MTSDDLSITRVLLVLKRWESEAKNPRNDGWVQLDYKERIKKVFVESSSILKEIKD
tara:strand:- start:383 stop:550 length:168 start_codon:yes stop_codon:yes gene_type:complete